MPNYRAMARNAARRYGLNPGIFERQIQQESGFAQDVITGRRASSAGAQGIAQIMPQTAKGWGVDPLNPRQALDAAAKNMARYVKQFGSYDKALRAYNAGPGAVEASKGYSETNNYVKTILGGRSPSARGVSPGGGGARTVTSPEYLKFDPGDSSPISAALNVSTRTPRVSASNPALPAFAAERGIEFPSSPPPVRQTSTLDEALAQINANQPEISTAIGGGRKLTVGGGGGGGGGLPGGKVDLKELFWQGPGGVDIDENKKVPQGFVSGHEDHVHVAAPKGQIVALGKLAQRMGLNVGENPRFGGVDPVHASGSFHYSGQAIDVSGDPKKMARYAHRVARMRGG